MTIDAATEEWLSRDAKAHRRSRARHAEWLLYRARKAAEADAD